MESGRQPCWMRLRNLRPSQTKGAAHWWQPPARKTPPLSEVDQLAIRDAIERARSRAEAPPETKRLEPVGAY